MKQQIVKHTFKYAVARQRTFFVPLWE